uniref:Uncharacterized protein n=1 Tax=Anguilla anguilla TaxID=7936 RepID=A0A0E9WZ82_ANGAN
MQSRPTKYLINSVSSVFFVSGQMKLGRPSHKHFILIYITTLLYVFFFNSKEHRVDHNQ